MSTSEFRYNKKRKHYAYLFKTVGLKRKNILISSKPIMIEKKHNKNYVKTKITINIVLYRHPNFNKKGRYYLIPRIYVDNISSFDAVVFNKWSFDKNDKRKIKRIKRGKKKPATTPLER